MCFVFDLHLASSSEDSQSYFHLTPTVPTLDSRGGNVEVTARGSKQDYSSDHMQQLTQQARKGVRIQTPVEKSKNHIYFLNWKIWNVKLGEDTLVNSFIDVICMTDPVGGWESGNQT